MCKQPQSNAIRFQQSTWIDNKFSKEKSVIFFSSTQEEAKKDICEILNFQEKSLHIKYLGLPLFFSRLSLSDCLPIVDKVRRTLLGWKAKILSFAGRIKLIRSTLSAYHIFWASCFLIP